MKSDKKPHIDTLAIHAGEVEDQYQALNPPIYMSSTFTFNDIQQADDTFSFKRKAYVYTRGGNPTINLFEKRMAALESGVDSVAFSSGMAAITTVLLSLVKKDEKILVHNNIYGSTFSAVTQVFPRFGIKADFVNMTNIDSFKDAITPDIKVIYFETPTNPSLEIIDIAAIVEIARNHGIKVVVDNTFATPYLQRPLELGVDVVVHSATKYLSGHGDVVGGIAISGDDDYIHKLKFGFMCELGGVISPFNAWLILRGLKTLGIRMSRHTDNAKKIVGFLQGHPRVEKIMYPELSDHPNHNVAKAQMTDFGGIVSFELDGGVEMAKKLIENMHFAKLAVSLGDAETLVEIPAFMTHRSYSAEDLGKFGFSQKTIRISTGLEHHNDIINDIEKALFLSFK